MNGHHSTSIGDKEYMSPVDCFVFTPEMMNDAVTITKVQNEEGKRQSQKIVLFLNSPEDDEKGSMCPLSVGGTTQKSAWLKMRERSAPRRRNQGVHSCC